jgi:hypothetical protein
MAAGFQRFLEPPRLRTATAERYEERHATWLELFLDLVFVVAIAELGSSFAHHVSARGFLIYLGLFVPIVWASATPGIQVRLESGVSTPSVSDKSDDPSSTPCESQRPIHSRMAVRNAVHLSSSPRSHASRSTRSSSVIQGRMRFRSLSVRRLRASPQAPRGRAQGRA